MMEHFPQRQSGLLFSFEYHEVGPAFHVTAGFADIKLSSHFEEPIIALVPLLNRVNHFKFG